MIIVITDTDPFRQPWGLNFGALNFQLQYILVSVRLESCALFLHTKISSSALSPAKIEKNVKSMGGSKQSHVNFSMDQ